MFIFFFHTTVSAQSEDWLYFQKKGVIEYNAQMYDFAEENLTRALEYNSNAYIAANYLGHLALQKKMHRKALKFYQKSLTIETNQHEIHYLVGEIYDYLYYHNKALISFKKAISIEPSNYKAHIGLCRTCSLQGDYDLADKHYKTAYSLRSDKTDKLFKKARDLRGEKKYKSALILLYRGIELNPAHTEIYFEISSLHRNNGEYAKAIAVLEKYKYYRPHDEIVYVHIAHIYYSFRILPKRRNDYLAAIINIKKAISLNENEIRHWELLEDLYSRTENEKEYIKANKKVLELLNKSLE